MAKRLFLITNLQYEQITNYIKESTPEMKKVTWPTKKETYNYTLWSLESVFGTAAFLGALRLYFQLRFNIIIIK